MPASLLNIATSGYKSSQKQSKTENTVVAKMLMFRPQNAESKKQWVTTLHYYWLHSAAKVSASSKR